MTTLGDGCITCTRRQAGLVGAGVVHALGRIGPGHRATDPQANVRRHESKRVVGIHSDLQPSACWGASGDRRGSWLGGCRHARGRTTSEPESACQDGGDQKQIPVAGHEPFREPLGRLMTPQAVGGPVWDLPSTQIDHAANLRLETPRSSSLKTARPCPLVRTVPISLVPVDCVPEQLPLGTSRAFTLVRGGRFFTSKTTTSNPPERYQMR